MVKVAEKTNVSKHFVDENPEQLHYIETSNVLAHSQRQHIPHEQYFRKVS